MGGAAFYVIALPTALPDIAKGNVLPLGGLSFAQPHMEGGSSFSACLAIGIIVSQKFFLFFSASFSIVS